MQRPARIEKLAARANVRQSRTTVLLRVVVALDGPRSLTMGVVKRRHALLGVLAGGATALLSSPAAAVPTQPGGLTNDLFQAQQCEFCHGYNNPASDAAEPAYSPFNTWQGTLMANAARDPVFWAGVAVAEVDDPEETQTCVRCHAPRAFLNGHETVTSFDELNMPDPENPKAVVIGEDNGVECEFCHRIVADAEVPPGNAMYTIADEIGPDGQNVPRHGPWDYSDGVPEPPHDFVFDTYISSSRLCGTCHDVTTPTERVDDDGVGMGIPFNEQRTYAEWEGSAYAQFNDDFRSCQDCHMTPVDDKPGCTNHLNQFNHPTGGARHDFNGANRFMLELLKREFGDKGSAQVSDIFYDLNLERIDEFVLTSADVAALAPAEVDVRDGLANLEVTVTNNTGHKLPSGYSEGRVMWIEVIGRYGDEVLFSSGAWDQEEGIQDDDQLHRYEAIGEDYEDGQQFRLLRNNHWVVDNRIPPLGAQPNIETDPVGDRYTLLADGTWPNFDTTTYTFDGTELADTTPEDANDDQLDVTIRLLYLINTPEYIDFLEANGAEAGGHVAGLFDEMGGATPTVLNETVLSIPLVGLEREGGSSSSSTTEDSGSSSSSSGEPQSGTVGTSDNPSGATLTEPPADGTDDDSSSGPGQSSGDEGCACTSTGTGAPTAAWLLLPLLALRRRRRR